MTGLNIYLYNSLKSTLGKGKKNLNMLIFC